MYKIARIAFKTLSRRILLVYHACFFYMHVYTCARKQKKETEKNSKELFSLWISFPFSFLAKRQKKRGVMSSPSVPSFFCFKFLNFQNI